MSDTRDSDSERYYRNILQQPTNHPVIPPELEARANAYLARTMQRLATDRRVQTFLPERDSDQLNYVHARYGITPPAGIGVRQGNYVTLRADEVNDATRFIATDYLMDCHALVLVARDAQGNVQQTSLSHIDGLTNVARTVPELLAQMPADSRIEATVIGSTVGRGPYLQADLMQALADSPRIHSLRYNFDLATTVAVDSSTGRILVAEAAQETRETAYNIRELPLAIDFGPEPMGYSTRHLAFDFGRAQTPRSTLGLHHAYRDGQFVQEPVSRMIIDLPQDFRVDQQELQQIVRAFGQIVQQELRLDYRAVDGAQYDEFRATISTVDGARIGEFTSFYLDPALGRSGTVRER